MGELVEFPKQPVQEAYLPAFLIGRHFGVSLRTLQRWRTAGCPHSNRRFRISEVEEWLTREDGAA